MCYFVYFDGFGGFILIESMNNIEKNIIKDIPSYLSQILALNKDKGKDEILIFRGEISMGYSLKPSIGRAKDYSLNLEEQLFLEFKRQYYSYTDLRPKTDMDVLFLAQHYRLKTRLLDWSYNPLVALYFACEKEVDSSENDDKKNGRVYYQTLKNKKFDSLTNPKMPTTIKDMQSIENNIFIVPDYTDIRYRNQQALFMLCSKPNEVVDKDIHFLKIDESSKEQIRKDLALLGYSKTFIYPMLESLCKDINNHLVEKE